MKYSIFQYSQEKLLANSLDVIDALILSWFSDFFVGSMEKKIFKDEGSKNGKLYGWVKLSKVMEDLPCIGINSEKGIKRRFDGFVEKGIMERKSLITQNGKKTYYRPTELYESLINTKANQQTEKENPEDVSHAYETIHAENKNSHRTKTTDADYKSTQKSSHDYQNIHAEGNENIHAHDHENIHALNDSSISDDITTDAAIIQSESDKIFGKNYFDSGFPQKAADFFKHKNINIVDVSLYLKYIHDKVLEKDTKNPRGLAYRLFYQDDIFQEFLENRQQQLLQEQEQKKREEKLEKRKITCPVCNNRFLPDYTTSCTCCNFSISDFKNINKINRQKKFNELSPEIQKKYDEEYLNFKSDLNFIERVQFCATEEGKKQKQEYILSLDKKYGLVG